MTASVFAFSLRRSGKSRVPTCSCIILMLAALLVASCGGGSSSGGNTGGTSGNSGLGGSIILPAGSMQPPRGLVVSSFLSQAQTDDYARFKNLQLLPNNLNTLYVKDSGGNVVLMSYLFPASNSIPSSLQQFVVSQTDITINAESTALALCMNNPILSGLPTDQLINIADTIVKTTEFKVFVGEIEASLVGSSTDFENITTHADLYIKASQITEDALSSAATSASSSAKMATVMMRQSITTTSATSSSSTTKLVPNVVNNYFDASTATYRHAFVNDAFVTYLAEFSPTVDVNPVSPILIDRQRSLSLQPCLKYPFLCASLGETNTPFDVNNGKYTITIWRGFSPEIWLAPDGTLSATRCLTTNFSDAPCLASEVTVLDFASPILAPAGIQVTGAEILNALNDSSQWNEAIFSKLFEAIEEIEKDNAVDGLIKITETIRDNSELIAQKLKSSNKSLANADVTSMSAAIKDQASLANNIFKAGQAISAAVSNVTTTLDEVATLVPMAADFFNSADKQVYYLQNGQLVDQLPAPITSIVIVPPTPTQSQAIGNQLHFSVMAIHSDNTKEDVTSQAQMSVADNIGVIDQSGSFKATAAGQGYVTAAYDGFSANTNTITTVTATAPALTKIAVQGPSSVLPGQTAQYAVLGIYADGSTIPLTNKASWTVQGTIGTVTQSGLFSALQEGSGTLQVTYNGIVGTTSTIAVSSGQPPLAPTNLNGIAVGSTQINLTWSGSTGASYYIIYRNGVRIGSTTNSLYSDNALVPSTTYDYYVTAFGTNGESAQGVTCTVTTLGAGATQADLVPQSISVSPNPATAGGTVTVGYYVANTGGTSAPASHTRVQIKSASNQIISDQTFSTSAISANSSVYESHSMSLAGTTGGTYYVYVIVDTLSEVSQSSTSNDGQNNAGAAFTVQ